MTSALGVDLSAVRIHTDPVAQQLNRGLAAKAFTFGSHIYFRQGAFQPSTHRGRDLLAHELVHVHQQSAGRVLPRLQVGGLPMSDSVALEREAGRGRAGDVQASPAQGSSVPGVVQRAGIRVSDIPNLTEEDRESFLRIQGLLGNKDELLPHLQALSKEVGDHDLFEEDPQAALKAVLAAHEEASGFSTAVPTVTGFVSPEEFSGMIRRKTPFDDLGASAEHGSATHRIQWNVIGRAMAAAKGKQEAWPGAETAADLYARTANEAYRITTPKEGGGSTTHYPWDALVDRVGANPSSENTFVTFAEQNERDKEVVRYQGQDYNRLPYDAGLPTHFSRMLRSPDQHFGKGHELGALSQAVEASYQATAELQKGTTEAETLAQAERHHGQYTSALSRLPGLKNWYGAKVAYANEAQYLASPQAWKYQKVLPRPLRTGVSTMASTLTSGAAYVLGAPLRWWRGGRKAD